MLDDAATLADDMDAKTTAIVTAARTTFLAKGFDAASMDAIALAAGVSKRTVYNRFRSKEELFAAAIVAFCKSILPLDIEESEANSPTKEFIRDVARRVVNVILTPEALALRRIAAFEAQRTPALGRAYLKHGPQWLIDTFTPVMKRLMDRGALRQDDPEKAVWRLGYLITEPLQTTMLMGVMPDDPEAAINAQIDDGLAAFEQIYGV